jgi:hypothetical protein
LEAILELQNALLKDYYKDFIVSINDEEIDFNSFYSEIIIYKGNECIEKDFNVLEIEINNIIDDVKPLYIKAVSDLLIKLSNLPNKEDKLNYLTHSVQLLQMPLKQLKKDFYIEDIESRYYVKQSDFISNKIDKVISGLNVTNQNFTDKEVEAVFSEIDYSIGDMMQNEHYRIRFETLIKLPYSLFTITGSFINILYAKIDKISPETQNEESVKSSKQLTTNQIVLILQEIGFFTHPNIEDASKVKQAELISSMTGIHQKTITTNIQKLEKSLSVNGANYQKDIDKISKILDGLI